MDEGQKLWFDRVSAFFPLLIALFAAVLSINDLYLSTFGVKMDAFIAGRDRNLNWYQAKGIKSTQVESQLRFFNAISKAGIVDEAHAAQLRELLVDLDKEVERYEKDRKEILQGSKTVGEANWSQDVNGVMGQITGVNEFQAKIDTFRPVRALYTNSSMFLRICLALGAVGLMIADQRNKLIFISLTLATGLIGTVYFALGFVKMMPM